MSTRHYCHKYCRIILSVCFIAALCIAVTVSAALVETPEGVVGYKDTAKQPWSGFHKHDPDRPTPPFVETGTGDVSVAAPSDADDLSDLSAWQPNDWEMVDGKIEAGKAYMLTSKKSYGDCQVHLEYWTPPAFETKLESRGNSGVFFMGRYEVQIYDSHPSHKKQVYPDGQGAAIFGETPPLVNACRKEGQWQSYDIIFKAPVFKDDKLEKPASITMLHNGVLVHLNTVIHGPVGYRSILPYSAHAAKLPLSLQGHGVPLRFRNVWVRPLNDVAKKMVLFNGKNLDGWKVQSQTPLRDPSDVWTVQDGILKCTGVPNGYIRTVENYSNYKLHLEWRWADKPTNSGVLLHIQGTDVVWPLCIEAQMMDQNAGDFVAVQNAMITVDDKEHKTWKIVPKKHPSSEKPTGQWNSYDIICDGNTIELTVNGVKQHYGTNASPSSGHIGLESEGSPIEFRNIYLIPLKK